jgi:hypothetical protein
MDTFDENWENEHRNKKSKNEGNSDLSKWEKELRKETEKWEKERAEKGISDYEKLMKEKELKDQIEDLDPKTADEVLKYANETVASLISKGLISKEKKSMVDNKTIPFLGGRPVHDTVIGADDIVNLNIALNTCSTLEEFFLQV